MNNTKTEYIIMTSSAKMPARCRGHYRNVAVVEVVAGVIPKMISARAKGLVRIVEEWGALNVGKTERCAYRVALSEARELCAALAIAKKTQEDIDCRTDDEIARDLLGVAPALL